MTPSPASPPQVSSSRALAVCGVLWVLQARTHVFGRCQGDISWGNCKATRDLRIFTDLVQKIGEEPTFWHAERLLMRR